MNPHMSDETLDAIYKSVSTKSGNDIILLDALDSARKIGAFSSETIDTLLTTTKSGLSMRQKILIRTAIVSCKDERVANSCKYVSLTAEGAPETNYIVLSKIMKVAESDRMSALLPPSGSRIGAAHALLAMKCCKSISFNTEELLMEYPGVVLLFAENDERLFRIHDLIAERGIDLGTSEAIGTILDLMDTPMTALSSGLL